MQIEIKTIGDPTGLILPKELLARLRLEVGDRVFATEGPERSIIITPFSEDDERTMQIARSFMKKYAKTLRTLSK